MAIVVLFPLKTVKETEKSARLRDSPQEGSKYHFPLHDEFRTPPGTALNLMRLLPAPAKRVSVLEPSASSGNIVDAIDTVWGDNACKYAVDIQRRYRKTLKKKGCKVIIGDFLTLRTARRFDWIIGNPPFSNGVGAQHILKAWSLSKPRDGSVVMMLPLFYLSSRRRYKGLWEKVAVRRVWVLAERPQFAGPGGRYDMMWIWLQRGYRGQSTLSFVSIHD